ncbi:MAG TPA: MerR family transcriptional regulator [Vicinamibacterales bacterium]|nr:MerR family transcriptional regulator [Vicinamibacterales bacterium]
MQSSIHHPNKTETFLEPADAAREIGVTPAQIHRLTARGILQAVARTVRGTRLYLAEDVARVVAERKARR